MLLFGRQWDVVRIDVNNFAILLECHEDTESAMFQDDTAEGAPVSGVEQFVASEEFGNVSFSVHLFGHDSIGSQSQTKRNGRTPQPGYPCSFE
ncbi:MAG TPA: hypothetical protein VN610_00130 [Bryobacteraceae bacterium]|nr:hypothetical protein [Bryobacteraceae bacterium]